MGETTGISWTDHTHNPWWGCHKVSAECTNCYAEATAERFHPGHWGLKAPRWFFGDKHWNEPLRWNAKALRDGVRRRVFCASMADVFEFHPVETVRRQQDEARARLFDLIKKTPGLDWLLLTKRPENFATMLPWTKPGHENYPSSWFEDKPGPWRNVWLGVTAGVRDSLPRIATLRATPAAVRFVSCEPVLEDITATDWDAALARRFRDGALPIELDGPAEMPLGDEHGRVHWLIIGDESGRDKRPAMASWIRTARDAAARHGVAFHFKQWAGDQAEGIAGVSGGGRNGKIHLPLLDGRQHAEFPKVGA